MMSTPRNVDPVGKILQTLRLGLVASALIVAGCSTTIQSQSFRNSPNSQIASAQIATDANFARYDRVQASELGIFFPTTHLTTAEDLKRIRRIFREAFVTELQDYDIVTQPGPTTMRVDASLIDLRYSSGAQIPQMRSEIRDIAVPGSLVFLMEMRDSESGKVLARAGDTAVTPTFSTGADIQTDWVAVEEAAQHWAALFRTFLDENLAK